MAIGAKTGEQGSITLEPLHHIQSSQGGGRVGLKKSYLGSGCVAGLLLEKCASCPAFPGLVDHRGEVHLTHVKFAAFLGSVLHNFSFLLIEAFLQYAYTSSKDN
jgi:hypothetical protein